MCWDLYESEMQFIGERTARIARSARLFARLLSRRNEFRVIDFQQGARRL